MEEKIKKLKQHLRNIFPTLTGGKAGFWVVGEEEIWKTEKPETENGDVFHAEIRNGIWIITPVQKAVEEEKRNVTFRLSAETADRLKILAANDQRSQAGELEWLISERWKDIQVI